MVRLLTLVFVAGVLFISACGASDTGRVDAEDSSHRIHSLSMILHFPDGYSYDRNSGALYGPSSVTEQAAPSYVTSITLTLSGAGEPIVYTIPLNTGIVDLNVPPGDYLFSLVVTTQAGDTFTGQTNVTMVSGNNPAISFDLEVNGPPTINSLTPSNSNPQTDERISLSANVFDPDSGDTLSYSWSASGGSISGGSTANWTAPVDTASVTISLTINDGHGGSASRSVTIPIKAKPIVDSVTTSDASPKVKDVITLTCTAHDANNNIATYAWTGSDGFSATGASTSYTVTAATAVTFTCTVTDSTGLTDSGTTSISSLTAGLTCAAGMVKFTGGTFTMGDDAYTDSPQHTVTLSDFCIDTKEVTQAQHQAWGADTTWTAYGYDANASCGGSRTTCPAENVDWANAQAYCVAQGKRLPTEAEWEYAARNGGTAAVSVYATGNAAVPVACTDANYTNCNGGGATSAVGSYAASASGLFDMAGNVIEWAGDWYDVNYYTNGQVDPTGPATATTNRVARGGASSQALVRLEAAKRSFFAPATVGIRIGWRCAKQ